MRIWLDAQPSPRVADWIEQSALGLETVLPIQAYPEMRSHGIFRRARSAAAVVLTKDQDFVEMVERLGPPTQVLRLTCGNTSNQALKTILAVALPKALELLPTGEPLVEITDI